MIIPVLGLTDLVAVRGSLTAEALKNRIGSAAVVTPHARNIRIFRDFSHTRCRTTSVHRVRKFHLQHSVGIGIVDSRAVDRRCEYICGHWIGTDFMADGL